MVDQAGEGADAVPPVPTYSWNPVPTIYADGIANVAHGPGIIRSYLIRFDPSLKEVADARPTLVAQLIMPTNGFLMMATFFDAQVQSLIKSGEVTQEQLDGVRQAFFAMTNAPGS